MYNMGFPGSSAGKESTCNAGDLSSIPRSWRSPGEGNSYPLESSGHETSIDCIVHGITKNRTRLSNFHFRSIYVWACLISSFPYPWFFSYLPVIIRVEKYKYQNVYRCVCICSVVSNSLQPHGPSGSSVHGILPRPRILEWVPISHSRRSSWPRNWICVSCIFCNGRRLLYHWATWEAPVYR